MIPRIGRPLEPLKRSSPARRRASVWSDRESGETPPLALAYSNGYVTVEISQAALDAYIEQNGDVPLPVSRDSETGDRRVYDVSNRVRVVYDGAANLREVATRSNDGLFVRINFTDAAGAHDD